MKYLLNIDTEERIELWKKFKSYCALRGESMIDVLFEFIKKAIK